LGLLPGVAIDQHFRQRNRFADLSQVVERFPTVLGIGIDEGTALVVQAPTRCEVIGAGSVWLSYPGQEPNQRRDYIEHPTGSKFDLRQP
jgi:cyanophycinase